MSATDDEYEEISSDEVDEIVEALEVLIEHTESETIRSILEDAAQEIHNLYYSEEGDSASADAA